MVMPKDLTVREGNFVELRREPIDVLADAKKAAKALTTVIDQKPRKVMIKGQVYLEYEDWQTVAQFYGYTVRTHNAMPVEFGGVKGAKAEADLIDFRTGIIVGGAEAYCMSDEENWGNKPWFQLASMAQTRAGSKAIRNRMAWVVVLAGYSGTPAEEIIQGKVAQREEKEEHWCEAHQTKWFKKGKMKSYAHPLDTGQWCYEHSKDKQTPTGEQKPTPSPEITPDLEQAEQDTKDLWPEQPPEERKEDVIPKTLSELYILMAEAMGWRDTKTARSWLVNKCKIPEDRIIDEPNAVHRLYDEVAPYSQGL